LNGYRLSESDFRAVAGVHRSATTLRRLVSAQLNKHRLLVAGAIREHHADARAAQASELLSRAEAVDRRGVDRVLADPPVGVWATRCLTGPGRGRRTSERDFDPDDMAVAYLCGIGAVCARRAGLAGRLPVPVTGGRVTLPTLGVALLPAGRTEAEIEVGKDSIRVIAGPDVVAVPADPSRPAPHWLGRRCLDARYQGMRLRVACDDVDPYRDSYHLAVAGRLPDLVLAGWQEMYAGAWRLLVSHLPRHAAELREGLRALVPLADSEGDAGLSATSRAAFGAFALTRPASGADLAITMVHEFQHAKLNALLDLVPLTVDATHGAYFVPWRKDPRPIRALLHGCFAFLGVARAWSQLLAVPAVRRRAEREFASARAQVQVGVATLARSAELTSGGRLFVRCLEQQVRRLDAVPVPEDLIRSADERVRQARATWLRANPDVAT
jgi:HEXXH motif-containing protein